MSCLRQTDTAKFAIGFACLFTSGGAHDIADDAGLCT